MQHYIVGSLEYNRILVSVITEYFFHVFIIKASVHIIAMTPVS